MFRQIIIYLILAVMATPLAAITPHVKTRMKQADELRQTGQPEQALLTYDTLRAEMDSSFNVQYDSQILPVRLENKAKEAQNQASRQQAELLMYMLLLALVLLVSGAVLVWFIRLENKRIRASEAEMLAAADKAEMAERSKSMFLSNMTHEIRAPLNSITGFSEVLAFEGIDDETRHEAVEIIEMNSSLLQNLINDVVGTACLDLREMQFRIVVCDVVKLSRNVTEMVAQIKKTDATMSFTSDTERLMVMADPLRLQQVLVNVLVNATKFCKQGSIVLNVTAEQDRARISVTDTGIGIPLEKQAGVFQRFERVMESAEGFGLGLSICKFIIERMGGDIWVDPEYTAGARFIFTVPYNAPKEQKGESSL